MEVNANSLERVEEYMSVDQESKGGEAPPAYWPAASSSIKVKGLTASYAPELPPVLKNVSFEVKGGEKVGIVGRTGIFTLRSFFAETSRLNTILPSNR